MPTRDQNIAALTRALVAVEAVILPLQTVRLELLDLLLKLRPQCPAPPDPEPPPSPSEAVERALAFVAEFASDPYAEVLAAEVVRLRALLTAV